MLENQLEHKQVPKRGMEPDVRKVSVPCWHAIPVAVPHDNHLVKVKLGIKVMKLAENLISWEVTAGQGSECRLTFLKGGFILLNKIPVSTIKLPE